MLLQLTRIILLTNQPVLVVAQLWATLYKDCIPPKMTCIDTSSCNIPWEVIFITSLYNSKCSEIKTLASSLYSSKCSKAKATASAVRSSSSSPLYKAANAVRLSPSSSGAVRPSFSTTASTAESAVRLNAPDNNLFIYCTA